MFVLLWTTACITPSEGQPVRAFRPLVPPLEAVAEVPLGQERPLGELRLRPVVAASHLKSRMVYREDDVEFGFREFLRWAELPEEYVERALAEALFESGTFVRSEQAGAPSLTVELLAFEELRDQRECRVELGARWESDEGTVRQWRAESRAPRRQDSPRAVAVATGEALGTAVTELVQSLVSGPGDS